MKKTILITVGLLNLSLMSVTNADETVTITRDSATQVVTDSETKLQWEDDATGPVKKTHPEAVKYCASLNFANHEDWRLPSTQELEALAKSTKVKFPEKPVVKNISLFTKEFWTSETFEFGEPAAAAVKFNNFDYGEKFTGLQRTEYYVRCVRKIVSN